MRNNDRRKYQFYYCAGLPVEICGNGSTLTAKQAAEHIQEEWAGQRERFLEFSEFKPRPGNVFTGRRFIIVCCQ
jgi:transposase